MKGTARLEAIRRNNNYDDIINLPHHQSETRPHMSIHDRAAQFAPFAALTGHSEAIAETGRLTDKKLILDDEAKEMLDAKLKFIEAENNEEILVKITYFVKDEKKEGGAYLEYEGFISRIDSRQKTIRMDSGLIVSVDDIYDIESDEFGKFMY